MPHSLRLSIGVGLLHPLPVESARLFHVYGHQSATVVMLAKTPRAVLRVKNAQARLPKPADTAPAPTPGLYMERSQSRISLSASFEALAIYFPCMNSFDEDDGEIAYLFPLHKFHYLENVSVISVQWSILIGPYEPLCVCVLILNRWPLKCCSIPSHQAQVRKQSVGFFSQVEKKKSQPG
ncbi:Regulating synaptic membrane exocytosis protein 4 [Labeo rohita]|uniref:Regulating synaptic membrane exocytosis protein 4 n=1 Tax=Labeo rohita TaxID=84645 RepID=A0ABQ8MLY6_LABRO|nr:Regulating synaptic membrane exocytosis protein 4 [Labeo rohita]